MIKNKKAQVSEGITWVTATLIIAVILIVSIIATSAYVSTNKGIQDSFFASNVNQKSFFSYLLTDENGKTIFSNMKETGNMNSYEGNLAIKIFNGLYKNDYSSIWVGISVLSNPPAGLTLSGIENPFFGQHASLSWVGNAFGDIIKQVDVDSSELSISNNKYAEVVFTKKIAEVVKQKG